jgi:serine/threonine-protein kinase HipA
MDTIRGMAFAIERFDRLSDGSSVHVEDFAQIFGIYPADKYGKASMRNIAEVIATESEEADVSEFIRRLTFNTLIGNADMHLKNWSMIYLDRRRARIAPAYDFVSTISYLPDESAALKYSRTKRFSEFSKDELSHLAAKARISEKLVLDTAQETVDLFQDHWCAEKANLPLAENVINAIESHLETLPIV